MNLPIWLKNNATLIRNLGFTFNRSLLVVLTLGISSSIAFFLTDCQWLGYQYGPAQRAWWLGIDDGSVRPFIPVYQLFVFTSHLFILQGLNLLAQYRPLQVGLKGGINV
ncbi:hypothetical protein [Spirosoma endophyticum]|uniref:Uncharacterized protein n=1 Tax=Spirosoma endophyticum TaxID=662367 RepID=A0A1I2DV95_9BACT|nr:hypothetical protein [Spirosoma endophyticum]SFE83860.1 hypothetical protein SAMN05216167_12063 [Spirosoma endophyticum]